jgi:hypothetical protein
LKSLHPKLEMGVVENPDVAVLDARISGLFFGLGEGDEFLARLPRVGLTDSVSSGKGLALRVKSVAGRDAMLLQNIRRAGGCISSI